MRFEPADTCTKFVIEERIESFLKAFRDADYYLFVEDGNEWVQTETARKWMSDKRIKGIIKQTTFTVVIEETDKIRLVGNYSVYGPITVTWQVKSARRAFAKANGLCEAVLAEVGNAAQEALRTMSLEDNAVNNSQAAKAIDSTLRRQFRERYSVELRVTLCNLSSRLTDIAEKEDYQAAEQMVQLSLDERRRHHELGLRLLEEQQRIQLAAAEVVALGNAQTIVERGQWELMQEKISTILGPNADPLLAMAMMMGPDAYNKLLESRVELQRINMDFDLKTRELKVLEDVAAAQYRRGQISFGNTTPYVPALEASGERETEAMKARLQRELPSLSSLIKQPHPDGRVEFLLTLPEMKISAMTSDGRITGVKYGTNSPSAIWGTIPNRGSLEEALVQLVRDISQRNSRR